MTSIEQIERQINSSEALAKRQIANLLELAIDLYVQTRVEGTNIEADGDMLLFQWGTYDWGQGKQFEVDLTRQIMLDLVDPDEASDSMRQLRVRLAYSCTEVTERIGRGNQWCATPATVSAFRSFIQNSQAFSFAVNNELSALFVELDHV